MCNILSRAFVSIVSLGLVCALLWLSRKQYSDGLGWWRKNNVNSDITSQCANIALTVLSLTCAAACSSPVTSAQFTRYLTVPRLINDWTRKSVTALSLSANGQWLLIGHEDDDQLHIYTINGSHVRTFNMVKKTKLYDAVWTPHSDYVVYTTFYDSPVFTVTTSGEVKAQTKITHPKYLSVSSNNAIYLVS